MLLRGSERCRNEFEAQCQHQHRSLPLVSLQPSVCSSPDAQACLIADLRGRRQVLLVRRDPRAQLLDLRLRGADLRGLISDGSRSALRGTLPGLDLELRLLRLIVAEVRELLVELGLSLALLDL